MKNLAIISTFVLSSAIVSVPAHAKSKGLNDAERLGTFTATTVAGAAVGGPIGMIVGAISGAYLSEKSKKNFQDSEKLASAEGEIMYLNEELSSQKVAVIDLESRMAEKLEFQVMFPTGGDELTFQDKQRIESLAKYLNANPQLQVRLDGHADPRGTDEYNNVLAAERAKSVSAALVERGIKETRIHIHSHGSSFATVTEKNRDQYAFERRVHIEVFNQDDKAVAAAN